MRRFLRTPRHAADRRRPRHARVGVRRLALGGPVHEPLHGVRAARPLVGARGALRVVRAGRRGAGVGSSPPRSPPRRGATARQTDTGDGIGRIEVPRLGVKMVLVYGTDHDVAQARPRPRPAHVLPRPEPPRLRRRAPDDVRRAVLEDRLAPTRRRDPRRDAVRHVHLHGHRQPHRRGDRPLGAEVEALRADRAAGVPPAVLRVAPLDHVRPPHEGRPAGHGDAQLGSAARR